MTEGREAPGSLLMASVILDSIPCARDGTPIPPVYAFREVPAI
jgi:hypothetical protein